MQEAAITLPLEWVELLLAHAKDPDRPITPEEHETFKAVEGEIDEIKELLNERATTQDEALRDPLLGVHGRDG